MVLPPELKVQVQGWIGLPQQKSGEPGFGNSELKSLWGIDELVQEDS